MLVTFNLQNDIDFFYKIGKHNSNPTDVGQHTTHKHYDRLQSSTDDDSLITTVEKQHYRYNHSPRAHHAKITDILVGSSHKIPLKWRKKRLERLVKKKLRFSNSARTVAQKIGRSKNWLGRIIDEKVKSRKVIRRKSRDDGTYENDDDDEHIQSKDEDDDEDVQLIIIPRKPRKHLAPKVEEEHDSDDEEFQKSDREDDSENSKNSRKDSKKPYVISKNFRQHLKNSDDGSGKNFETKLKSTDDDATLTLQSVASEENDDDSKNNHQSNAGDYDLHLKVKDRSGSRVKLSGDLPGNIGNLMAVGEDGGKVQIQNTRESSRTKPSHDLKLVNAQGGNDDASTDDLAQNLLKIKSGKLKHPPYPSTILLNPDRSVNEHPKLANEEDSNQDPAPPKTHGNNQPQSLSADTLTTLTRGETNAKVDQPTNQQPSNNIFAPMEFENGDDELMATSRLLDIAQKADDVSSLKEIKDPSNTVKERPKETLKDLTKG